MKKVSASLLWATLSFVVAPPALTQAPARAPSSDNGETTTHHSVESFTGWTEIQEPAQSAIASVPVPETLDFVMDDRDSIPDPTGNWTNSQVAVSSQQLIERKFQKGGADKAISLALQYLKAAPGQRYALAFIKTKSSSKHTAIVWYKNIPGRGPVLMSDDATGYGEQEYPAAALSSLHVPVNPANNAAIRQALAYMSKRRNPAGTCLSSVIGVTPGRENLLSVANRFGGTFANGAKQPGAVFMKGGMGTYYSWQAESFALGKPEMLREMGFETLAVGHLLEPTRRHYPKLADLEGIVNQVALDGNSQPTTAYAK